MEKMSKQASREDRKYNKTYLKLVEEVEQQSKMIAALGEALLPILTNRPDADVGVVNADISSDSSSELTQNLEKVIFNISMNTSEISRLYELLEI